MNLKTHIICAIIMLVLGGSALADNNISGLVENNGSALADSALENNNSAILVNVVVYDSDTYGLFDNVRVCVNSTPYQIGETKNGTCSFELLPGDYIIIAKYSQNDIFISSVEQTIKVEEDTENGLIQGLFLKNPLRSYLRIVFVFILLFTIAIFYRKYKYLGKKIFAKEEVNNNIPSNKLETSLEEISPTESSIEEPLHDLDIHYSSLKTKLPLPPELQEVINVIRANRGRIAQKELRTKLKQSEVKVSIMLSDLERRGLIEKFKSGRENIVILIDEKF